MRADSDHLQFLTCLNANVLAAVTECTSDGRELLLQGTRGGILSLSNMLLWLNANSWRRELLNLTDLSFYRAEGFSMLVRISDSERPGNCGTLLYDTLVSSIEWTLCDIALERAGLVLHRLACRPEHEYDFFEMSHASDMNMRVRMSDAADWL